MQGLCRVPEFQSGRVSHNTTCQPPIDAIHGIAKVKMRRSSRVSGQLLRTGDFFQLTLAGRRKWLGLIESALGGGWFVWLDRGGKTLSSGDVEVSPDLV